jgi:exodeoxyribonuclease III
MMNGNGVNGRLPVLLHWLARSTPDIACLQELKAWDEKFPIDAIREAGYEAVWHGQKSWNGFAILSRGETPQETRRGLPGGPDDTHSCHIKAILGGITVGCLYLPNGNPAPGPKFDCNIRRRRGAWDSASQARQIELPSPWRPALNRSLHNAASGQPAQ